MWEVDREWYQAAKTLHFGLKLLVGLLIILFCTALFVDSAHAAVVQSTYAGVVWGVGVVEKPTGSIMESYDPVEGCIVNAPNAFSAACFAVGGNPATLTSEQKALLSNASTGGDFYTFSQNFANYGGSFDSPDDWYVPKFYDVWHMFEDLYGDDLYAATFTSAQLRGAKADYQLILDGGGTGGGTGDYVNLSFDVYYAPNSSNYRYYTVNNTRYYFNNDNSLTPKIGSPVTVRLTTALFNRITSHSDYIIGLAGTINNPHLYVYVSNNTAITNFPDVDWSSDNPNVNLDRGYKFFYIKANATGTINYYEADITLTAASDYDNSTPIFYSDLEDVNMAWKRSGGWTSAPVISMYQGDNSPTVPPTNWPDNPTVTAPEPPELPDPYNPIIDDQPIDPTPPQNPIYPPILNITEDTYTADLQGILDAMDAHCQHLRSALHTEMSNLWTALSTKMTNDFSTFRTYMTGQIGWLGDLISDEMEATRDYMQQLAEWLAEQIEYSFTGTAYDDNTLITWLRKIYYRLGSGGVNTRPTDPVANPVDAGDWLSQLIANLFSALNALAGGLLTSVGSALDLMHTKFPFSLPWDLLAILSLFVAPPTAPDFDVPIYTLDAACQLSQVGTWEIDLSDLSPYLEGIRWMQKICFVYFLAVHTKDWMDTLEKVVA